MFHISLFICCQIFCVSCSIEIDRIHWYGIWIYCTNTRPSPHCWFNYCQRLHVDLYFQTVLVCNGKQIEYVFLIFHSISDIYQMPEPMLFWYMIVPRTRVTASYCLLLLWPAVHETTCCISYWFASHAAQNCCISLTWARRVCFQSKRSICAKGKDLVPWLKLAPSLRDKQLFHLARTMDHPCFYDTKARVIYTCGIQRPASNLQIS